VEGLVETISDLERIMSLPRRPPVVCDIDPVTRRYPPATEALVDVVTARFARPKRLSCACRERRVLMAPDGSITIARVLPEGDVPEVPIRTSVAAFVVDNQMSAAEVATAKIVAAMRPGDAVTLPAADDGLGHPCIERLNPLQAWTLREAVQVGGIVGFKGVGSGKTIDGLLIPLLFPDARLAALIIEPKQRHHYRSHYLRIREHFRVSSIVFDDGVSGHTVPGTVPLHLISYSILSRTASSDMLDELKPDVLIIDEAHRACGQSAINRRVKRYCKFRIDERERALFEGRPVRPRAVNLFDWSGTLEQKSVDDTQMLCAYSLGTGSPVPLDPDEAEKWSAVFDVSHKPDRKSPTAKALWKAFGGGVVIDESVEASMLLDEDPENVVRRGFQKWRMWTPGIITGTSKEVTAAHYFTEREVKKIPSSVREALSKIRNESQRPDGMVLEERIQQVSCARQVACGFYSYWAYPKHPCSSPTGQCDPRCEQCLLIDEWFLRRKAYAKELRAKLLLGQAHLDSPKNCEDAAERFWREGRYAGNLPTWGSETWRDWKKIEKKVEYDERVKWLDDYLAQDAAEWATNNKGVVWFQSVPFGRKVSELTKLPYFNGGPGGEQRLRAEKGDRSILVSIDAHGAGTDGLQNIFWKQLIAEVPASNATSHGLEQLFGRLLRRGQRKDAVETEVYLHVSELKDALRNAIAQAEFNFAMTGNKPLILMADKDMEL
jgi:hypothetical protein